MADLENVTLVLSKFRERMEKLGIERIGVFGSTVRGENRPDSDIDLLIELRPENRLTLFSLVSLEQDLSEAFRKPVDLVISADIRPRIREVVLSEVRYV